MNIDWETIIKILQLLESLVGHSPAKVGALQTAALEELQKQNDEVQKQLDEAAAKKKAEDEKKAAAEAKKVADEKAAEEKAQAKGKVNA